VRSVGWTVERRGLRETDVGRTQGKDLCCVEAVDSSRDEHDEHPVAAGDGSLDDVAVVRCSWEHAVMRPVNASSLPTLWLPAYADDVAPRPGTGWIT
jgi:hypothetical protein